MSYKRINDTLVNLVNLNYKMKAKSEQRKIAKGFNEKTALGNEFDIKQLTEELQELQLEFNREKRNL